MRIPDELARPLRALGGRLARRRRCEPETDLRAGTRQPMGEKKRIAEGVVAYVSWRRRAARGRDYFERTIQRARASAEMPERPLDGARSVADVMVGPPDSSESKRAAAADRRAAVKIDGSVVSDPRAVWPGTGPAVLQVGARKFVRIVP